MCYFKAFPCLGPMSIYNYGYFCGGSTREPQPGSVGHKGYTVPPVPLGPQLWIYLLSSNLVPTVANGAANTSYPANTCSSTAKGRTTAIRLGQSATAELTVYILSSFSSET